MLHKENILINYYGGITNRTKNTQRCVEEIYGGKMLTTAWCSVGKISLDLKPKDIKKHNHKTKS